MYFSSPFSSIPSSPPPPPPRAPHVPHVPHARTIKLENKKSPHGIPSARLRKRLTIPYEAKKGSPVNIWERTPPVYISALMGVGSPFLVQLAFFWGRSEFSLLLSCPPLQISQADNRYIAFSDSSRARIQCYGYSHTDWVGCSETRKWYRAAAYTRSRYNAGTSAVMS